MSCGREARGIVVLPLIKLTARAILIRAAMIGYDQKPEFDIHAPGQKEMDERIAYEIQHGSGPLRRAVEAEGMADEWDLSRAKL